MMSMKKLTFLLAVLLLWGCKHEKKTIELLSYFISPVQHFNSNTINLTLRYYIYSTIDEDGTCLLQVKNNYNSPTYYCKILLDQSMTNRLFLLCNQIKKDTIMTPKTDNEVCLYDGPTINFVKKNSQGKDIYISFIQNDISNPTCLTFYNYIDSIASSIDKSNITDTTTIAAKTKKRCEIVYNKIKPELPIIRIKRDVEFDSKK